MSYQSPAGVHCPSLSFGVSLQSPAGSNTASCAQPLQPDVTGPGCRKAALSHGGDARQPQLRAGFISARGTAELHFPLCEF
ncbi:hypothetical protein NDU88_003705 [Pleurodeles waltl]|uniref:Uncharacterized protein n=1 Tax=Pleurodeles waltl TaxID=8319 RepID=A0AAV7UDA1_PLEWA|nr:hypothetical protein NDU88_003705 [Pleurodeles waltl]